MAQIVIKDLKKQFGDFTAVRESSFTIEDGEFFMLLGPSGCGKTTTLRMIAGLELPTSGDIFLDGEEISQRPPSQRDIAFVFQMFALYPHMNVRRNISYPLVSQGMPRAQVREKVAEVGSSRPAIMRSVVVLPQPEGPSSMKNSPSSILKDEDCTAVKSPNSLRRLRITISAIGYSGKWLTMMNMTVPMSVVMKL